KSGQVHIENCTFARNASDGVDIDFGVGQVVDSGFMNNVNDGLDVSGSQLTVINNRFENNGDKGFSVGEESQVTIANALFHRNSIGVSTKDLSHAQVTYATFVDNGLAIEAIRKKPFFGGGSGEVVNSVFSGNLTLFQDDYFSQGQVSIHNSLTDDALGCPTCLDVDLRFQSVADGDYRLRPDTVSGEQFEILDPQWAGLEGRQDWPSLPGVFATTQP
ncbi:MAG: right-handed parallel beta-helix repeat-containing protein, partial [Chloroflexota bacterium]